MDHSNFSGQHILDETTREAFTKHPWVEPQQVFLTGFAAFFSRARVGGAHVPFAKDQRGCATLRERPAVFCDWYVNC